MSERENILGRIREALKTEAPFPGSGHDRDEGMASRPGIANPRRWLPKVGDTLEEQLELFANNAAELKAEFQQLSSPEEARHLLERMGQAEKWKRVATHRGTLTDEISTAAGIPLLYTEPGYDVAHLEGCDVGITECDALVAQTGTVLVTNNSAGGRALSVLPPHHVVLARRGQVVPDLTAAVELLKKKYAPKYPSMISFITGPSRTGDIERILVLGAHGPRRLTIICF